VIDRSVTARRIDRSARRYIRTREQSVRAFVASEVVEAVEILLARDLIERSVVDLAVVELAGECNGPFEGCLPGRKSKCLVQRDIWLEIEGDEPVRGVGSIGGVDAGAAGPLAVGEIQRRQTGCREVRGVEDVRSVREDEPAVFPWLQTVQPSGSRERSIPSSVSESDMGVAGLPASVATESVDGLPVDTGISRRWTARPTGSPVGSDGSSRSTAVYRTRQDRRDKLAVEECARADVDAAGR